MKEHPINQKIRIAVDAAIFTVSQNQLKLLLIQMKKEPYEGRWALPGGLLADRERAESAVRRILSEQTGLEQSYLEPMTAFDQPDRDPFGRVISLPHLALIPSDGVELRTTDKYSDVRWWSVSKLPHLAYDHQEMAKAAVRALRARLEYSGIAWSVLPARFTLTQMQEVYEAIMGQTLDKRNFRKRVLDSGLVRGLAMQRKGAHRPARLYRFKRKMTGQPS